MADNTLTSAASLLWEMQGTLQELYPKDYVFLAELSGVQKGNVPSDTFDSMGANGRITQDLQPASFYRDYSGLRVRVPLQPIGLQGAGSPTETGTINVPIPLGFSEAHITLARVVAPASITMDLADDTMDNAAVNMITTLATKQRQALAETVNDQLLGDGVGTLATAISTQAGAGGLTLSVAAGTDFDKLYIGRVVDVLTAASGADPGQGLRRKISAISESATAGTVTFDTAQQASDGGSGNITLSNAVGVYIPGSWGNVIQGLEQAAAITGTFEGIAKGTYAYWQGTDARQGVTTVAPLSEPMLDTATLLGQRAGVGQWDFAIGDPQAINVYKNGKASQLRYNAPTTTLSSGFKGITYDGLDQELPLIPERRFKTGAIKLIKRDRMHLYGRHAGPKFEDSTGSPWQRFSRSLPRESWYVDRLQLGVHDCASIVFLNNLAVS